MDIALKLEFISAIKSLRNHYVTEPAAINIQLFGWWI